MSELMNDAGIKGVDPRLLEEAFKRARELPLNKDIDSNAILSAIFAEARRGSRDIYSLVGAAAKASHQAA